MPDPFPAPRPTLPTCFLARHLAWPLAAAVVASVLLMRAGGDRWLADALFGLEGGHWVLREHWLTSTVIHRGGKWLSLLAGLVVLALNLAALRRPRWAPLRRPLLYLLLASALGSASVSLLKAATDVACPWDLARYGGARDDAGASALAAARVPRLACYPAGHASAGYAWVSLYFAALLWRPRWRWRGLAIGLAAGALFGAGQQLRGAHFLSHDVAALAVCWVVSLGLYCLFVRVRPGRLPPQVQA